VTADVCASRFDAAAMLRFVGADHLDLQHGHASVFGNTPPFDAGERPRIHAVGDNSATNTQVVRSHGIGNGVSLALHDQSGLAKYVLDRIDTHVNGGQRTRQLTSDCRLANTRESTQHDQHVFTPPIRQATA
jgi:hypothetical protein